MAFIRDFMKSSKKRLFGDQFTPVLKRWGGFFNFLEVYLLIVCIKYQKNFGYWDGFSRFWEKCLPDLKKVISRKTRSRY